MAQTQMKDVYAKRVNKGVKTFDLSPGDLVLKKNMKNIARKGGQMDVKWTGPYT